MNMPGIMWPRSPVGGIGSVFGPLDFTGGTVADAWTGYTIRNWYGAAALNKPASAPTIMRLGLWTDAAEGFAWNDGYVGHVGAESTDYTTPWVRMTRGGSTFINPPANSNPSGLGLYYTDWMPFVWDRTKNLVIAFQNASGGGPDRFLVKDFGASFNYQYYKNALEAATADVSSGTYTGVQRTGLVAHMEMDGF